MSSKDNPALELSFQLSVDIIKKCYQIQKERKEYIITNQLIRSVTSIGANLEEAIGGQSERDFMAKLSISYKEARETLYWLRLMKALDYLANEEFESFSFVSTRILKILGSSIRTLKNKLNKKSLT